MTAGGVDADPEYILAHLDGSLRFGGLMVGLIGIDRAYPALNAYPLLNPACLAVAEKDTVDGYGCGGGILAWANGTAAKYTYYPTSQALAAVPRLKRVLTKLNLAKGPVPIAPSYIYNTVGDEIMRIQQVDTLVKHWCAAGDSVYYDRSSVGDHISGISVYNSLAIRYLQGRFGGHKVSSTCASGPHDPKHWTQPAQTQSERVTPAVSPDT